MNPLSSPYSPIIEETRPLDSNSNKQNQNKYDQKTYERSLNTGYLNNNYDYDNYDYGNTGFGIYEKVTNKQKLPVQSQNKQDLRFGYVNRNWFENSFINGKLI
jgi:hypothetical protein